MRRFQLFDVLSRPVPPHDDCDADNAREHDQRRQRGILDPSDRRNADAHDHAQETDLPGESVDARGESPQRQQCKDSKPGCVRVEYLVHARQQQQVHHDKERNPVRSLCGEQPNPGGTVPRARPSRYDADDADGRCERFPVEDNGFVREAGVGHANYRGD